MWYDFYDSDFKHARAKWWQPINIVTCYDSWDGFKTCKVFCLRVYNVDIFRLAINIQ